MIRELDWTSPSGKKIHIKIKRFTSLDDLQTAAIRYSIRPINFMGDLCFVSGLNGDVKNENIRDQMLHVVDRGFFENVGFLTHKTRTSRFTISCAMVNNLHSDDERFAYEKKLIAEEKTAREKIFFQASQGENYTLDKLINFYTSRDVEEKAVQGKAVQRVKAAAEAGFERLFENHSKIWRDFWEKSDVVIKGELSCQQGIRFGIFHLMQSCGKDGRTNIGANGLTGDWYQGHVFWDTEIYMMPLFLYNHPQIARSLLMYRYQILDKARERARQMEDKGALFSWNSINGEECGWIFEAATAQYHINCYTNTMTRFHLNFALDVAGRMRDRFPEKNGKLVRKIDLREEELALWRKAADNMYIPFNERLNIHAQDDSYLYRDPIDLDKIAPEKMPSMDKLHPLNLWRLQASKQADVVLLMFLRSQEFPLKIKKSNYDFYEPRTIHDSSLSPSIFSIIASEIGYYDRAYDYFLYSCRMDLDDLKGTTRNGIHAACMGGTWMSIVHGFAGMRIYWEDG